jgi:chemotaxis protein MotB
VKQLTIDSNLNSLDALQEKSPKVQDIKEQARRIREALRAEIENGSIAVATEDKKDVIQILENASFDSGLAVIRQDFLPVLTKIAGLIDENSGMVMVSGHTDNIPISTERFRSNWELSTSRAVSVAHVLLKTARLDESRFVVTGHADTRPRADNLTSINRAKNRRVDISIVQGTELDQNRSISIDNNLIGSNTTEAGTP